MNILDENIPESMKQRVSYAAFLNILNLTLRASEEELWFV